MLSIISVTLFGMPEGMLPEGTARLVHDSVMDEKKRHVYFTEGARKAAWMRAQNAGKRYLEAMTTPMTAEELGKACGVTRSAAYAWLAENEGRFVRKIGKTRPLKWEKIA